ncbi:MAG: hypothetical protein ACI80V_001626 [Rhodothermales bacterium]|jgi:hypothetical protein
MQTSDTRLLVSGVMSAVAAIAISTWVMGPAVVGIDVMILVSLLFWWPRRNLDAFPSLFIWLAVGLQSFHFAEEYATGFYMDFPGLLGYIWSPIRFAAFNLVWLGLFALGGALGARFRLARLPVWLLAVASVVNGVVHPLMA